MSVVHVHTENGSLTTLYNCSTVNCIKVKISAVYDMFAPDVIVLSGGKALKDDARAPAICSVNICNVVYNEAMWKRVLLAHAQAYDVPGMKRAIVTMTRYGQVNDAMCSQVFVQYIRDSKFGPDVNSIWAFIACGAMIDYTDGAGHTALMYASEYGHARVVKCLVITGADINLSDKSGKTPLAIAKERNHTTVENLLVSLGAKAPDASPGEINTSPPTTVCAPSQPSVARKAPAPANVCAPSPPLVAREAPSPTVCAPLPPARINAPAPGNICAPSPPLVARKAPSPAIVCAPAPPSGLRKDPSPPLASRNGPAGVPQPGTAKKFTPQKRADSPGWQAPNPHMGGDRNLANGKRGAPQDRRAAANARENPDRKSAAAPVAGYAQKPDKMEAQDHTRGGAGDLRKKTIVEAAKPRGAGVHVQWESFEVEDASKVQTNGQRQQKNLQKKAAEDNVAKKVANQDDALPQQGLQKRATGGDAAKEISKQDDPRPRHDLQKRTTKHDAAKKTDQRDHGAHQRESTRAGTETAKIRRRSNAPESRASSDADSLWSFLVSKGPVARDDTLPPRPKGKSDDKHGCPSPKRKRGAHARRRSSVQNGYSPKCRASRAPKPGRRHQQRT